MYANSRFKKSVNEWGRVEEWILPGDKISQGDLNVSDEEWQELVDRGAVVEEYPDGLKDQPQTPPAQYYAENPDEAPESTLDETSSSAEMMVAGDTDKPLPTGEENKEEGEKKAPWQNK